MAPRHTSLISTDSKQVSIDLPSGSIVETLQGNLNTFTVDLSYEELMECKDFLEKGVVGQYVARLCYSLDYLLCGREYQINPDLPEAYWPIKLRQDWSRKHVNHNEIETNRGLIPLSQHIFDNAPLAEIDETRRITSIRGLAPRPLSIQKALDFTRAYKDVFSYMFGVAEQSEKKGILLAGGAVFGILHNWHNSQIKDYDLFFYGYSKEEILDLLDKFVTNNKVTRVIRSKYTVTVTFVCFEIQFIMRLYDTMYQILLGFDLDSCRLGYDGKQFYTTESGLFTLRNRINVLDFDLAGACYAYRLAKYAERGIAAYAPNFEWKRVKMNALLSYAKTWVYPSEGKIHPKNLSKLLYLCLTEKPCHKEAEESDYEFVTGQLYYDDKLIQMHQWDDLSKGSKAFLRNKSTGEVVSVWMKGRCHLSDLSMDGHSLTFVTINPSQFSGSFNPLNLQDVEKDWYKGEFYE